MSTNARSYVVKIKVGGVVQTRVWDSLESPQMTIGHPMRWVLERGESGVTVRNVAEAIEQSIEDGKGYHTVPKASSTQPSKSVSFSAIEKIAQIDLPEARSAKTAYQIELRPVEMFPAAFETHPEGSGPLRVYACRGDWTLSSETLSRANDRYTGYVEHVPAFRLDVVAENRYRIKSKSSDLKVAVAGSRSSGISLASGETKDFSHDALQGHVIRCGEFEWRIEAIMDAERIAAADVAPVGNIENAQFKRASRMAISAVLAFLMLSALWPHSELEETLPTQTTRLVLKKPVEVKKYKTATAAAQGDRKARDTSLGNTPSKKPRGTQMAKTRVSPKRSSPTVAKAKQTGAKHVAKAKPQKNQPIGTKHAPKRPSPVTAQASTHPAKQAGPAHASKSHAKPGAISKSVAKAPANPSAAMQKTALAQAFSGAAFKNASKSALSGGMTTLLKSGKLAGGSGGAQGITGSSSGLSRSAPGGGGAGGGVGTRGVEVASLGGGSGLFGVKGPGYGRGSHAAISGQGKSFVSLDTGESDVDEGLTREQIAAVFARHMSEIRYCYDAARLRNPDTEGKLPVAFSVSGSGRVATAAARGSSVGDPKLESCLLKRLVTWQFPHPKGGVTVAASYPLTFKALGR
jgi:hypothetical protein